MAFLDYVICHILTFASLFLGLLVYLIVSTCTYGVNYTEKYRREIPDNFVLRTLSYQTEDISTIEDLFGQETIKEIESWEGVQRVTVDYVEPVLFLEGDASLRSYAEEQARYREVSEEEVYRNFQATEIGLPVEKLMEFPYQSTLSEEEIQACLQDSTGIFLADNGECDYHAVSGMSITVSDRSNTKPSVEYRTLGTIPVYSDDGSYRTSAIGYGFVNSHNATPFYTSFSGIERMTENPRVHTVRIESDERISNQLAELFAYTDAVSTESQLKIKAAVASGIGTIQAIGKTFGV